MKNKVSVVLLQILLFSPFCFAQNDELIDAMSFNIRYDNSEDGKQN